MILPFLRARELGSRTKNVQPRIENHYLIEKYK